MTSFLRPVGVHRDINELEFLSALLQSHQHVLRSSGTIKTRDIALYFKSRHGLLVSEEVIERFILTDLAGQIQDEPLPKEEPEEEIGKVKRKKKSPLDEDEYLGALDICQFASILLIPEILEGSEGSFDKFKLFACFREAFLAATKNASVISEQSLRELFGSVGEFKVSDEVIESMLQLASRPEDLMDALVSDISLFKEYQEASSYARLRQDLSTPKSFSKEEESNVVATVSTIHTAPSIDFSSDTFRRPLFNMLLWTAGIAAYFAYVLNSEDGWVEPKCDSDTTACNIASGIMSWLSLFLQLVCLGLPYIFLGSIGNADFGYGKLVRLGSLIVSMATIFLVTVYTFFSTVQSQVFDTSGNKDKSGSEVCSTDDYDCLLICGANSTNTTGCYEEYVVADDYYGATFYLSVILGICLLVSQLVDVALVLTPARWLDGNGLVQRFVLPGTVRQETACKRAASFRMKHFIDNAVSVIYDSTVRSSSNMSSKDTSQSILERFLLLPKKFEPVGGVIWAWKKIWNGSVFVEEGIWLNARLLACNFSQVTVFGILIFFTRVFYHKQKDFFYSDEEKDYQAYINTASEILYGNYTEVLGDDYYYFLSCSQEVLNVDLYAEGGGLVDYTQPWNFVAYLTFQFGSYGAAKEGNLATCFEQYPTVSSFFDDSNNVLSYESDTLKDLVQDFDISAEKYIAAVWCGLVGGFLAVIYIVSLLIPSFVSTVMKYRSGGIPSLTDPEFLRYRYAMDTVTVLLGSAFWGCFFTATGAMLFVVGLIFFIGLVPLIIGAVLGFVIILALRLTVLLVLRCAFFSAFFRKKPGAANVMFTVLEVWNIALTLGFVFIRSIKLILISVLYIARIDTPFLARGVGRFGPVELDSVAICFAKDILIHEAHRHMLIERFGLICMIKLNAGDKFGTRAGASWRLLFVLITMPWLRKYRVGRNVVDMDEQIAQMQEDLEEVSDIWERNEKMLEIQDLRSAKALNDASKESSDENAALRNRVAFLEEKIRSLEKSEDVSKPPVSKEEDMQSSDATAVTSSFFEL